MVQHQTCVTVWCIWRLVVLAAGFDWHHFKYARKHYTKKLGSALSSVDNNHILLSSLHTMFVIVDHQIAFRSCFDTELVDVAEIGVAELVDAAGRASIPIITSLVKTNLIDNKLSATLEPKIPNETA